MTTTTGLATTPSEDPMARTIVMPDTGEIIDVDDAEQMTVIASTQPDRLVMIIDAIDDAVRNAQDNRAYIAQYLIDRMDMEATQTLHAGRYTVTVNGSSDEYESFDADLFYASLSGLVADGVITQAAADKAVRVKREVSKSGLNSLRALRNDSIDAAIESCKSIAMRRRRISVKSR